MTLAIGRGKRAFIAGMTGSGKTRAGLFLLHHLRDYPAFVLDTKIEEDIRKTLGKNAEVVEGIANYDPLKAKKPFVIMRPSSQEMTDPELIDDVILRVHNKVEGCAVYIDEAYQVHVNGRAGPGLIGLMTRGRSRKQTCILCTQRPAWISRFCLTEADKYYIFRLGDKKDRMRMMEVIPDEKILEIPPKYHFTFYDTGELGAQLYAPFPLDPGDAVREELKRLIDGASLSSKLTRKKLTLV